MWLHNMNREDNYQDVQEAYARSRLMRRLHNHITGIVPGIVPYLRGNTGIGPLTTTGHHTTLLPPSGENDAFSHLPIGACRL